MMRPNYQEPGTQITARSQGVITVGSRVFVDPATYATGVIAENFTKTNVSSDSNYTAYIDLDSNLVGVDFSDSDYVLVYPVSSNRKLVGIGFGFANHRTRLAVKILTKENAIHMAKLVAEVMRCIDIRRRAWYAGNSLTGVSVANFGVMESPQDQIQRGHYFRTYDLEINWKWAAVKT